MDGVGRTEWLSGKILVIIIIFGLHISGDKNHTSATSVLSPRLGTGSFYHARKNLPETGIQQLKQIHETDDIAQQTKRDSGQAKFLSKLSNYSYDKQDNDMVLTKKINFNSEGCTEEILKSSDLDSNSRRRQINERNMLEMQKSSLNNYNFTNKNTEEKFIETIQCDNIQQIKGKQKRCAKKDSILNKTPSKVIEKAENLNTLSCCQRLNRIVEETFKIRNQCNCLNSENGLEQTHFNKYPVTDVSLNNNMVQIQNQPKYLSMKDYLKYNNEVKNIVSDLKTQKKEYENALQNNDINNYDSDNELFRNWLNLGERMVENSKNKTNTLDFSKINSSHQQVNENNFLDNNLQNTANNLFENTNTDSKVLTTELINENNFNVKNQDKITSENNQNSPFQADRKFERLNDDLKWSKMIYKEMKNKDDELALRKSEISQDNSNFIKEYIDQDSSRKKSFHNLLTEAITRKVLDDILDEEKHAGNQGLLFNNANSNEESSIEAPVNIAEYSNNKQFFKTENIKKLIEENTIKTIERDAINIVYTESNTVKSLNEESTKEITITFNKEKQTQTNIEKSNIIEDGVKNSGNRNIDNITDIQSNQNIEMKPDKKFIENGESESDKKNKNTYSAEIQDSNHYSELSKNIYECSDQSQNNVGKSNSLEEGITNPENKDSNYLTDNQNKQDVEMYPVVNLLDKEEITTKQPVNLQTQNARYQDSLSVDKSDCDGSTDNKSECSDQSETKEGKSNSLEEGITNPENKDSNYLTDNQNKQDVEMYPVVNLLDKEEITTKQPVNLQTQNARYQDSLSVDKSDCDGSTDNKSECSDQSQTNEGKSNSLEEGITNPENKDSNYLTDNQNKQDVEMYPVVNLLDKEEITTKQPVHLQTQNAKYQDSLSVDKPDCDGSTDNKSECSDQSQTNEGKSNSLEEGITNPENKDSNYLTDNQNKQDVEMYPVVNLLDKEEITTKQPVNLQTQNARYQDSLSVDKSDCDGSTDNKSECSDQSQTNEGKSNSLKEGITNPENKDSNYLTDNQNKQDVEMYPVVNLLDKEEITTKQPVNLQTQNAKYQDSLSVDKSDCDGSTDNKSECSDQSQTNEGKSNSLKEGITNPENKDSNYLTDNQNKQDVEMYPVVNLLDKEEITTKQPVNLQTQNARYQDSLSVDKSDCDGSTDNKSECSDQSQTNEGKSNSLKEGITNPENKDSNYLTDNQNKQDVEMYPVVNLLDKEEITTKQPVNLQTQNAKYQDSLSVDKSDCDGSTDNTSECSDQSQTNEGKSNSLEEGITNPENKDSNYLTDNQNKQDVEMYPVVNLLDKEEITTKQPVNLQTQNAKYQDSLSVDKSDCDGSTDNKSECSDQSQTNEGKSNSLEEGITNPEDKDSNYLTDNQNKQDVEMYPVVNLLDKEEITTKQPVNLQTQNARYQDSRSVDKSDCDGSTDNKSECSDQSQTNEGKSNSLEEGITNQENKDSNYLTDNQNTRNVEMYPVVNLLDKEEITTKQPVSLQTQNAKYQDSLSVDKPDCDGSTDNKSECSDQSQTNEGKSNSLEEDITNPENKDSNYLTDNQNKQDVEMYPVVNLLDKEEITTKQPVNLQTQNARYQDSLSVDKPDCDGSTDNKSECSDQSQTNEGKSNSLEEGITNPENKDSNYLTDNQNKQDVEMYPVVNLLDKEEITTKQPVNLQTQNARYQDSLSVDKSDCDGSTDNKSECSDQSQTNEGKSNSLEEGITNPENKDSNYLTDNQNKQDVEMYPVVNLLDKEEITTKQPVNLQTQNARYQDSLSVDKSDCDGSTDNKSECSDQSETKEGKSNSLEEGITNPENKDSNYLTENQNKEDVEMYPVVNLLDKEELTTKQPVNLQTQNAKYQDTLSVEKPDCDGSTDNKSECSDQSQTNVGKSNSFEEGITNPENKDSNYLTENKNKEDVEMYPVVNLLDKEELTTKQPVNLQTQNAKYQDSLSVDKSDCDGSTDNKSECSDQSQTNEGKSNSLEEGITNPENKDSNYLTDNQNKQDVEMYPVVNLLDKEEITTKQPVNLQTQNAKYQDTLSVDKPDCDGSTDNKSECSDQSQTNVGKSNSFEEGITNPENKDSNYLTVNQNKEDVEMYPVVNLLDKEELTTKQPVNLQTQNAKYQDSLSVDKSDCDGSTDNKSECSDQSQTNEGKSNSLEEGITNPENKDSNYLTDNQNKQDVEMYPVVNLLDKEEITTKQPVNLQTQNARYQDSLSVDKPDCDGSTDNKSECSDQSQTNEGKSNSLEEGITNPENKDSNYLTDNQNKQDVEMYPVVNLLDKEEITTKQPVNLQTQNAKYQDTLSVEKPDCDGSTDNKSECSDQSQTNVGKSNSFEEGITNPENKDSNYLTENQNKEDVEMYPVVNLLDKEELTTKQPVNLQTQNAKYQDSLSVDKSDCDGSTDNKSECSDQSQTNVGKSNSFEEGITNPENKDSNYLTENQNKEDVEMYPVVNLLDKEELTTKQPVNLQTQNAKYQDSLSVDKSDCDGSTDNKSECSDQSQTNVGKSNSFEEGITNPENKDSNYLTENQNKQDVEMYPVVNLLDKEEITTKQPVNLQTQNAKYQDTLSVEKPDCDGSTDNKSECSDQSQTNVGKSNSFEEGITNPENKDSNYLTENQNKEDVEMYPVVNLLDKEELTTKQPVNLQTQNAKYQDSLSVDKSDCDGSTDNKSECSDQSQTNVGKSNSLEEGITNPENKDSNYLTENQNKQDVEMYPVVNLLEKGKSRSEQPDDNTSNSAEIGDCNRSTDFSDNMSECSYESQTNTGESNDMEGSKINSGTENNKNFTDIKNNYVKKFPNVMLLDNYEGSTEQTVQYNLRTMTSSFSHSQDVLTNKTIYSNETIANLDARKISEIPIANQFVGTGEENKIIVETTAKTTEIYRPRFSPTVSNINSNVEEKKITKEDVSGIIINYPKVPNNFYDSDVSKLYTVEDRIPSSVDEHSTKYFSYPDNEVRKVQLNYISEPQIENTNIYHSDSSESKTLYPLYEYYTIGTTTEIKSTSSEQPGKDFVGSNVSDDKILKPENYDSQLVKTEDELIYQQNTSPNYFKQFINENLQVNDNKIKQDELTRKNTNDHFVNQVSTTVSKKFENNDKTTTTITESFITEIKQAVNSIINEINDKASQEGPKQQPTMKYDNFTPKKSSKELTFLQENPYEKDSGSSLLPVFISSTFQPSSIDIKLLDEQESEHQVSDAFLNEVEDNDELETQNKKDAKDKKIATENDYIQSHNRNREYTKTISSKVFDHESTSTSSMNDHNFDQDISKTKSNEKILERENKIDESIKTDNTIKTFVPVGEKSFSVGFYTTNNYNLLENTDLRDNSEINSQSNAHIGFPLLNTETNKNEAHEETKSATEEVTLPKNEANDIALGFNSEKNTIQNVQNKNQFTKESTLSNMNLSEITNELITPENTLLKTEKYISTTLSSNYKTNKDESEKITVESPVLLNNEDYTQTAKKKSENQGAQILTTKNTESSTLDYYFVSDSHTTKYNIHDYENLSMIKNTKEEILHSSLKENSNDAHTTETGVNVKMANNLGAIIIINGIKNLQGIREHSSGSGNDSSFNDSLDTTMINTRLVDDAEFTSNTKNVVFETILPLQENVVIENNTNIEKNVEVLDKISLDFSSNNLTSKNVYSHPNSNESKLNNTESDVSNFISTNDKSTSHQFEEITESMMIKSETLTNDKTHEDSGITKSYLDISNEYYDKSITNKIKHFNNVHLSESNSQDEHKFFQEIPSTISPHLIFFAKEDKHINEIEQFIPEHADYISDIGSYHSIVSTAAPWNESRSNLEVPIVENVQDEELPVHDLLEKMEQTEKNTNFYSSTDKMSDIKDNNYNILQETNTPNSSTIVYINKGYKALEEHNLFQQNKNFTSDDEVKRNNVEGSAISEDYEDTNSVRKVIFPDFSSDSDSINTEKNSDDYHSYKPTHPILHEYDTNKYQENLTAVADSDMPIFIENTTLSSYWGYIYGEGTTQEMITERKDLIQSKLNLNNFHDLFDVTSTGKEFETNQFKFLGNNNNFYKASTPQVTSDNYKELQSVKLSTESSNFADGNLTVTMQNVYHPISENENSETPETIKYLNKSNSYYETTMNENAYSELQTNSDPKTEEKYITPSNIERNSTKIIDLITFSPNKKYDVIYYTKSDNNFTEKNEIDDTAMPDVSLLPSVFQEKKNLEENYNKNPNYLQFQSPITELHQQHLDEIRAPLTINKKEEGMNLEEGMPAVLSIPVWVKTKNFPLLTSPESKFYVENNGNKVELDLKPNGPSEISLFPYYDFMNKLSQKNSYVNKDSTCSEKDEKIENVNKKRSSLQNMNDKNLSVRSGNSKNDENYHVDFHKLNNSMKNKSKSRLIHPRNIDNSNPNNVRKSLKNKFHQMYRFNDNENNGKIFSDVLSPTSSQIKQSQRNKIKTILNNNNEVEDSDSITPDKNFFEVIYSSLKKIRDVFHN